MKTSHLIIKETKHIPREMEEGIFYYSPEFEIAIHLCACGCKGETVTPLRDMWTLTITDGKPTLYPSIGNQHWPCKSHYWVTDGQVIWC